MRRERGVGKCGMRACIDPLSMKKWFISREMDKFLLTFVLLHPLLLSSVAVALLCHL